MVRCLKSFDGFVTSALTMARIYSSTPAAIQT